MLDCQHDGPANPRRVCLHLLEQLRSDPCGVRTRASCTQMPENGRLIMGSVKRRYSKEEFARRGDAIYEKDILPKVAAKDVGKFLAIDIETGEYEIAADEMRAGDKLRARLPEAQIWMVRIGYTSARR